VQGGNAAGACGSSWRACGVKARLADDGTKSAFDLSFLEDPKDLRDLTLKNTMILRHFEARLRPHLQLTLGRLDMDVHPVFFTRVAVARYGPSRKPWDSCVDSPGLPAA
jgi:hypothetical protein